jgi:hypothetical protein
MQYVPRKNRRRLAFLGVGAIAAISLAAGACSSSSVTHYGFSGSITSITPISNSQATTVVNIKNTGHVSGTASCSIELYSSNHTYTGFQTLNTHQNLNPGQTITRSTVVTVNRNGAHNVTVSNSRVNCYQTG